jgi:hypothetical protein
LLSKAMTGSYTSADGGLSAMHLMVDCDAKWKPWHDQCLADGESDGDCTVAAGILAPAALKLEGK